MSLIKKTVAYNNHVNLMTNWRIKKVKFARIFDHNDYVIQCKI